MRSIAAKRKKHIEANGMAVSSSSKSWKRHWHKERFKKEQNHKQTKYDVKLMGPNEFSSPVDQSEHLNATIQKERWWHRKGGGGRGGEGEIEKNEMNIALCLWSVLAFCRTQTIGNYLQSSFESKSDCIHSVSFDLGQPCLVFSLWMSYNCEHTLVNIDVLFLCNDISVMRSPAAQLFSIPISDSIKRQQNKSIGTYPYTNQFDKHTYQRIHWWRQWWWRQRRCTRK